MRSQLVVPVAVVVAMLVVPACSNSDAATSDGTSPAVDACQDAQDSAPDFDASDATLDQSPPDVTSEADAHDASVTTIDELLPASADAICGALFRCCDAASRQNYFAKVTASPSLQSFAWSFCVAP